MRYIKERLNYQTIVQDLYIQLYNRLAVHKEGNPGEFFRLCKLLTMPDLYAEIIWDILHNPKEYRIHVKCMFITKNAFLKQCNRLSLNYVTVAVVRNHFLNKAEESRIIGRVPNKPLNFILDDYHGKQEEVA